MIKKEGSQTKFKHNDYPIAIGTMNKANCKAAYVSFGCWVNAGDQLVDAIFKYNNHLAYLLRKYKEKNFGYNQVTFLNDVQNSDAKLSANKIRVQNRHTYLSVEVTLLFRQPTLYDDNLQSILRAIGELLVDDICNLDYLDVQVTKKG